jgi:hypothetical protein
VPLILCALFPVLHSDVIFYVAKQMAAIFICLILISGFDQETCMHCKRIDGNNDFIASAFYVVLLII